MTLRVLRSPERHAFLKQLLDGELSFVDLAHFAGQYHHVVAERHAAECIALQRVRLPGNGGDHFRGGGDLAKQWLQFTLAVGGVPGEHSLRSTRACVRAMQEASHASLESAVGVVNAIDQMEASMAAHFCGLKLRDAYELKTPRAVEYFERWSDRRDVWREAVGTTISHPDALAAHAAAAGALWVFLDGMAARPRTWVAWS